MNKDDSDVTDMLLKNVYKNKTILPVVLNMIFTRNRNNLFIDDLIWAFFQARDPNSLMLIANYLGSEDLKDIKLACKLLNFIPSIDMTIGKNTRKQYIDFLHWLEENYSFLYFTGESFQSTSKPIPYIVILDAKYLCRRVSLDTGKPFLPLNKRENELLSYFNNLDENNKSLLASFSIRIHYKNIDLWKSWINHPISEQISIAKTWL